MGTRNVRRRGEDGWVRRTDGTSGVTVSLTDGTASRREESEQVAQQTL